MTRAPQASRTLRSALPALLLCAGVCLILVPTPAAAHGSTQSPGSRIYLCRFEEQNNPMCDAAWSANPQALYDWMEVNIGDASGRHQELIPDGRLCSAGRSKYGAFDTPGPWPVTALTTDSSGFVDLVYENTAPHATEYYRVYITRQGFDARTDAPAWSDLELVHDSGRLDRSPRQHLRTTLPTREVPAILYIVWQRSDSPEAFYACSDVTVSAGAAIPITTPTTATTTTTIQATTHTTAQATTITINRTTTTTATPPTPAQTATSSTTSTTTTAPPAQAESDQTTEAQATSIQTASTQPPVSSTSPTAAQQTTATQTTAVASSTQDPAAEAAATPSLVSSSTIDGASRAPDEPGPGESSAGDDAVVAVRSTPTTESAASGIDRGLLLLGFVGLSSAGLLMLGAALGLRRADRQYPLQTSSIRRPWAQ